MIIKRDFSPIVCSEGNAYHFYYHCCARYQLFSPPVLCTYVTHQQRQKSC